MRKIFLLNVIIASIVCLCFSSFAAKKSGSKRKPPTSKPAPDKTEYMLGETNLRVNYLELTRGMGSTSPPVSEVSAEELEGSIVFSMAKFMQSLDVDARGKTARTAFNTKAGVRYQIKVMGHIKMGPGGQGGVRYIEADPLYVYVAGGKTGWDRRKLPAYSGVLGINGKGIKRKNYNPAHEYTTVIKGDGKPIKFKVRDKSKTPYENNSGHFIVQVRMILSYSLAVPASAATKADINIVLDLIKTNKWKEAISSAEAVKDKYPKDYTALNLLGVTYLKFNRHNKGVYKANALRAT